MALMRQNFPDVERQKILHASQLSLWKHEGEAALKYLREERHLSDDIIRKFQFGYCPSEFQHELAGRIIMPLFDAAGNLAIFTTRNPWVEKQYQHWHESYHKSNYLYGLHLAKATIRATNEAVIVEGQFDVTYLHTAGVTNTVGLCGSAFNVLHAALLSRYCSYIYFILDPDSSGDSGVARAVEMYNQYCLKNHGLFFIPIKLPEKLDPDEFLFKYGKHALDEIKKERKEKVLNG